MAPRIHNLIPHFPYETFTLQAFAFSPASYFCFLQITQLKIQYNPFAKGFRGSELHPQRRDSMGSEHSRSGSTSSDPYDFSETRQPLLLAQLSGQDMGGFPGQQPSVLHTGQPTHIIYPAESGPLAYHSMTAGQLAIASPRYSSSHIGYHGSSTPTTTEALQQLTHFSSQSTPLRYVTNPQNTGYHSSTFQPRPVQGLAYGPVVQSSIQVATPIQYISPARPMQQAAVGYGTPIVPSTTSHYSPVQPPTQQPPERLPTYSQESFPSTQHQQSRPHPQWNFP